MAIIEDTPSTPPSPKPTPVKVVTPTHQTVAVDTRYVPKTSLLTHVEGASWTVSYYSQVLAKDGALSGQNLDRDAVYQQYRNIIDLELKVTSPLSQSQDTTSKAITVTGQANVYPCGLIPNEGDMFIADVGDGRAGVFRITSSEQRTIFKDTAWTIDYLLIDYATPARYEDLKEKTVETLVYISDFLLYGQKPLITEDEHRQLQLLDGHYDELTSEYFRRFLSNEHRTLVLPGQTVPIYDPFLTDAVLKAFGGEQNPYVLHVRELNISDDDNFKAMTLWDALLTRRPSRMRGCATKMGLVTTDSFSRNPAMNSMRYSGMAYVVYPVNPMRSEDDLRMKRQRALSDWELKGARSQLTNLLDLIAITELDGLPAADIAPINPIKDFYVFSEAFYNRWSVGQSALEIQANRYLNNQALDMKNLLALAESCSSWLPLDQFYQMPVLLMLIRATIRRM